MGPFGIGALVGCPACIGRTTVAPDDMSDGIDAADRATVWSTAVWASSIVFAAVGMAFRTCEPVCKSRFG